LSVVVPALLFARALARRPSAASGSALLRLMVWEAVKVVVTLAMLLASPRVVSQLSWPILVASFVVTMKMYGVGWWLLSRRRSSPG
jgi:ATP synthase protein I